MGSISQEKDKSRRVCLPQWLAGLASLKSERVSPTEKDMDIFKVNRPPLYQDTNRYVGK
jgi:hypothetical protein